MATSRALVRFFNTFVTAAPFFEEAFPSLEAVGVTPRAVLAPTAYRSVDPSNADARYETLRLHGAGRGQVALAYALEASAHLLVRRADMHVFLTQPPLFHIAGAALSRATRTPYLVHLMDLYPDLLMRMGAVSASGRRYRWLHRASRWALAGAERVVVLGRCMRRRVLDLGVEPARIAVLPSWGVRALEPKPKRGNPLRRALGIGGEFVVMYSGNMGAAHRLDTLLAVSERLRARSDVRFVFIGRGARRAEVERRVRAGQPNIDLLDYQPYEGLAHSISAADLHFVSLRAGFEGLMVPSKFYGAMACGRPTIYEGHPEGEVAHVISESSCGAVVRPGDVDGLERAILSYTASAAKLERDGANARSAYAATYHPDVGARRYAITIRQALEAARDRSARPGRSPRS